MSSIITTAHGGKLAYREAGSGPPLILVHGSPGEGRAWARVTPHLVEHYRVLTPDLPGYGGSDPVPVGANAQSAAMGEVVAALMATCDGPVRLCGHSYGGNVALHAAVARPDLVDTLTLFEPVFFRALALVGDREMLEPARAFFARYADRVTGGQPEAVSEMIEFWFGAGSYDKLPAPTQGYLQSAAAKNGVDVRAALSEQLTAAQLAGFGKPTLVAYGDASPPVAPAIAQALAGLLLAARLQAIAGAGHGMLDSHPAALAELILAN